MTKVGEHITLDIIGTTKEYDPLVFEKVIKEIDTSIVQEVATFEVYEGDNIPREQKSVAINVTLQADKKR